MASLIGAQSAVAACAPIRLAGLKAGGIAVSDPQVRCEATSQSEAQPATTKQLG